MNLEEIKEELYLPSNIKSEDIKTYLIYENTSSYIQNSSREKSNTFSNLGLKFKIATSSNYEVLYNRILDNAKTKKDLYNLLYMLNKKIINNEKIDALKLKAIKSISLESNFYISIGNTDPTIKFINATLDNNIITFDWNYSRKILQDEDTINKFKDIILSYKNELFELSSKQENSDKKLLRDLVLKGKMRNSLQGNIDLIKLSIYPELTENEIELNSSYFKLKNEILKLIESNIANSINIDD